MEHLAHPLEPGPLNAGVVGVGVGDGRDEAAGVRVRALLRLQSIGLLLQTNFAS